MSLPLPRRIAQAAPAPVTDLGGLTSVNHTATHTAGQATDTAGRLLGSTAETAGSALPATQALPNTGNLPLKGLPLT
jgi:hypothetical protein